MNSTCNFNHNSNTFEYVNAVTCTYNFERVNIQICFGYLKLVFHFSSNIPVGYPHGQNFGIISTYGFFGSNGAVIARKLFRVMGRHSELARHDRDDYVTIIWENILPGNLTIISFCVYNML